MKQISDQMFKDLVFYFLADSDDMEANEQTARRIRIGLTEKLDKAVQREQYSKRLRDQKNSIPE